MFLFLITSGAEALSLFIGYWDESIYRMYYVLASVQVAIMGSGAIYLFTNRKIINERNSGLTIIIFGLIWTLFAAIYQSRDSIFLFILVPSIIVTLIGVMNWIQIRVRNQENAFKISGMQFSHFFILFTLYIFLLMAFTVINAPLDLDYLLNSGGQEVGGHAWISEVVNERAIVRLFSPLNTVPGSVALIGIAFYSYTAWQWSIRKMKGHFDLSKGLFNIYIGIGALVLASAGTLSGFGFGVLYIGEAIGIILMYFGFLESDKITIKKLVNVLTLSWIRNKEDSLITAVQED